MTERDEHGDVGLPRKVGTLDQHDPCHPAGDTQEIERDLGPLQLRSESSTIQSGYVLVSVSTSATGKWARA